jgi:hypothetical protein
MPQESRKSTIALASSAGRDLILTQEEHQLICNCRALKSSARAMIFDLAENYTRTLPAERPAMRLVGAAD